MSVVNESRKRVAGLALATALATIGALAGERVVWAQTAAAAPPPDIVVLRNGGMVRGTISELLPGRAVEIQLTDGSKRRFARDEISYAGPSGGAPAQVAPPVVSAPVVPPAPAAGEARVQFVAKDADVRFFRQRATQEGYASGPGGVAFGKSTDYDDVCGSPCKVTLSPGRYTFGLKKGDGTVINADPVDVQPGDSVFEGTYETVSKAGLRIALGLGAVAGLAGGGVAFSYFTTGDGTNQECDTDVYGQPDCRKVASVPGILLSVGLISAGFVLALGCLVTSDEHRAHIVPVHLQTSSLGGDKARVPNGLAVQWAW